ncbi:uncharacterized protein LODBEIA_P52120 [Lodderomyces beijingensis]|uniref:Uncharacterized protein n=1 Tax=Lodderomyces beijingensis TaxID=1775926 RepID=A0ABP0ZS71_9ASCO
MAKKISKHSRAARRGEANPTMAPPDRAIEALSQTPAPENDTVRKSIIRTQIKNENLLTKKLESSKIRKQQRKSTSTLKQKLERNDKLQGVLSSKIDASIKRAKYVQGARRSNWDQTNANIEIRNRMSDEMKSQQAPRDVDDKDMEKLEEDAYVRKFYEEVDGQDREGEGEGDDERAKSTDQNELGDNRFALLEDVEA